MKAHEKTKSLNEPSAGDGSEGEFQVIDRRLTRLAEEEEGQGPPPAREESKVSSALEAKEQELEDLRNRLLRLQADFENFRKRKAQEEKNLRQSARDGLLMELLPMFDNLERALQAAQNSPDPGLRQGIEMVMRMWFLFAEQAGLSSGPKKGDKFDPKFHEAVEVDAQAEAEADTVLEVFQRGYHRGAHVLRPAKVKVAAGPAEDSSVREEAGPQQSEVTPPDGQP